MGRHAAREEPGLTVREEALRIVRRAVVRARDVGGPQAITAAIRVVDDLTAAGFAIVPGAWVEYGIESRSIGRLHMGRGPDGNCLDEQEPFGPYADPESVRRQRDTACAAHSGEWTPIERFVGAWQRAELPDTAGENHHNGGGGATWQS